MDQHLKWDEHIKNVESKISSAAGVLWKMKSQLPLDTKKIIYTTLIQSHLNYLLPIWGSASDTALKTLQVIQNRALRNVYGLDRLENRVEMYQHKVDNFLPIRALFYLNTATYIYSCLKGNYHSNLCFSLSNPNSSRTRRCILPSKSRTQYGSRRISSIGPRIFNEIPEQIQRSPHVHAFKRSLRSFVKEKSFMESCFSNQFIAKFV